MIAKQLETILAEETRKTDLSERSPAEMVQRFQHLRGFGLLPKGRGKNAQHLSHAEIVAGILSVVTAQPGFSGLASKVLLDIRPVGGVDASFERVTTLGMAIEALLNNPVALNSFLELRVSDSETYTNSHGRATIRFRSGSVERTANYVHKLASSLLQPGAEKLYNPSDLISSVVTETIFYPAFFQRLVRELQEELKLDFHPHISQLESDEGDDEEDRKEDRAKRLGLTSSSRFLNVAVDTQVTWPKEETLVEFEGHKLVLMPKTREHTTSIHIDLHGQRLTSENALSLIRRFLSILTWCYDQFAVVQEGWSGNPVPVPVLKRNLAFSTAYHWLFDRKIPQSPDSRKAIAIYRDGRNAEQNYLVSYAVLAYYKIIELRHSGRAEAKKWFRDNFEKLKIRGYLSESIARFERECGSDKPQDYLYRACRTAIAHANKPYSSDPDDFRELRRLHVAADILRELARLFIRDELGVSDCAYDGA